MSRDLNDDAELWQFTEEFGDRAIRIWIEVLSILDRTDNCWKLSGDWAGTISRRCRVHPKKVSSAILWFVNNGWLLTKECSDDGFPLILESPNFFKYHKRRDSYGAMVKADKEPFKAPPYPNLPFPNLPSRTEEEILRSGSSEQERSQRGRVGRYMREEDLPEHLRQVEEFTPLGSTVKEIVRRLH